MFRKLLLYKDLMFGRAKVTNFGKNKIVSPSIKETDNIMLDDEILDIPLESLLLVIR